VRLGERILDDSRARTIVLDAALGDKPAQRLTERGGRVLASEGTKESMSRALLANAAAFGCDGAGRFWFGDCEPRCDGLSTLARVLQLLGRSDAPASGLRVA
jgi:hypothetical protein